MEKIKICFFGLFALLITATSCIAQEQTIIKPGLIRAQLILSPSYLISSEQSFFYLHGTLEAYTQKNISIAGEGYLSLGNITGSCNLFDYNHSVFFGANLHQTNDNHDLFIGLQPGVSFTKLNAEAYNLKETKTGTNPLFSVLVGYNFYMNRFFHFFFQNRLVIGKHFYDVQENLAELRFSAGLGFNINAIKN